MDYRDVPVEAFAYALAFAIETSIPTPRRQELRIRKYEQLHDYFDANELIPEVEDLVGITDSPLSIGEDTPALEDYLRYVAEAQKIAWGVVDLYTRRWWGYEA